MIAPLKAEGSHEYDVAVLKPLMQPFVLQGFPNAISAGIIIRTA